MRIGYVLEDLSHAKKGILRTYKHLLFVGAQNPVSI